MSASRLLNVRLLCLFVNFCLTLPEEARFDKSRGRAGDLVQDAAYLCTFVLAGCPVHPGWPLLLLLGAQMHRLGALRVEGRNLVVERQACSQYLTSELRRDSRDHLAMLLEQRHQSGYR